MMANFPDLKEASCDLNEINNFFLWNRRGIDFLRKFAIISYQFAQSQNCLLF